MLDIKSPTPPGVAFIAAVLLLYFGLTSNNGMMVTAGWIFVAIGVLLQILYLRFKYGKLPRSS